MAVAMDVHCKGQVSTDHCPYVRPERMCCSVIGRTCHTAPVRMHAAKPRYRRRLHLQRRKHLTPVTT